MRVVLDACVLYPTVLREILIGAAKAGLYRPLWSARILEEWARAAARRAPADEAVARGEIALLRATFPKAEVAAQPGIEDRLVLPDENDLHVLAVAIAGSADAILTFNAQDFPRGTLAGEGLERRDPDGFLWQLLSEHPEQMRAITESVRAEAERLSGEPQPIRALMKRARLPRFGKALAA
ncbi:PIN domain-containing protein [Thioclava sp. F42-5]|uniref:RSP_2648 family PIN domain-containing protein n=1 Tax=Thioclava sp. F42-5 TaxID=1973005 RepID=UPI000B53D430|nr:PIN domain-containing protein [Thioclava sp. F42-5]OWY10142.1 PIN domain-containing protein [Thioclava sp. F42-5]